MIEGFVGKAYSISAKISASEISTAKTYISDAVDDFCLANGNKASFSVRILFGGENRDWTDTPLQCIYEYHLNAGKKDPVRRAAIDVGHLLKGILVSDKETYVFDGKDTGQRYRLK